MLKTMLIRYVVRYSSVLNILCYSIFFKFLFVIDTTNAQVFTSAPPCQNYVACHDLQSCDQSPSIPTLIYYFSNPAYGYLGSTVNTYQNLAEMIDACSCNPSMVFFIFNELNNIHFYFFLIN